MSPKTITPRTAIGTALAFAGYAATYTAKASERSEACGEFSAHNPAANSAAILQASAKAVTDGECFRLPIPIAEAFRLYPSNPYAGMTRAGYTVRRGAPTSIMVRLQHETRLRRLMIWQFSNVGTCFVRIGGKAYVVSDYMIPEVHEATSKVQP